jgi:3-deoxy-7-phosphoheptulonate synthase
MVEVHPRPDEAVCDGPQSLVADELEGFLRKVERVAELAGKELAAAV